MKIQYYVTYCARCQVFERNLQEAIEELNLEVKTEKIEANQAIKMGITSSPTLIIDGEIKSRGVVLSVDELKKLLKENI